MTRSPILLQASGLEQLNWRSTADGSCQDECEWLRGKMPQLVAATTKGKDDECVAAHVFFQNGGWFDGTPAWDLEHQDSRPVNLFQRQKLAAMFAACEWAGIADTPAWIVQEVSATPQ